MDIEFSICDNKIFILQARKITTLNDSNITVLDNSNIAESYPGISLPLTISFAHFIYSGVFKSAIARILKNDNEINSLKDVFDNMVGDCNGRMYYKISNWYEIIQRLPFSKKIIPIWQDMMGVKDSKVYSNPDYSKRANLKVYVNFLRVLKDTPRKMVELDHLFNDIYNEYLEINLKTLGKKEIIDIYNNISEKLFNCWDITLFNDMYTFIYTGRLKNKLKKHYENYEEVINNLISRRYKSRKP